MATEGLMGDRLAFEVEEEATSGEVPRPVNAFFPDSFILTYPFPLPYRTCKTVYTIEYIEQSKAP
jgi:rubrerythrin